MNKADAATQSGLQSIGKGEIMLMEREIWLEKEIQKHWSAYRYGQIEAVLKDKSLSLTKEDKEYLQNQYNESYVKAKREQDRWPWNESGY